VIWRIILVAVAIAALLLPLPPPLVERYYSSTLFPFIQSTVTAGSNLAQFAWFDVLLVVVLVPLLVLCARDLVRKRWVVALLRIGVRVVTVGAVTYLVFLATWGFNYRREPLRRKIAFDEKRITEGAAVALARETVSRVNALHGRAHADGWAGPLTLDRDLTRSFGDTTGSLGLTHTIRAARPKHSLLDLYFRRAGVAGMTDPFFLETLVASDILPFERPHVVAHEWAHLAGFTDEGEANFVGWLTCVRGSEPHRYSGWLFLYSEVVAALPSATAREVSAALASGPRADLAAIRQRYAREVSPRLSTAGWQVYDQYLKANRIDAGTASYAEVVQLILGTELR
jgi:hypothetical protein